MEDTEFSKGESILIGIIITVIFIVISGLIFAPDLFWDDFVKIYIWDPIVKDAGSSGDAGYSGVNTAVYILGMVSAVIVLQAFFRKCRFQRMIRWFGRSSLGLS